MKLICMIKIVSTGFQPKVHQNNILNKHQKPNRPKGKFLSHVKRSVKNRNTKLHLSQKQRTVLEDLRITPYTINNNRTTHHLPE